MGTGLRDRESMNLEIKYFGSKGCARVEWNLRHSGANNYAVISPMGLVH